MKWNEKKYRIWSEIDVIKFVKCGAIHHTFSAKMSTAVAAATATAERKDST